MVEMKKFKSTIVYVLVCSLILGICPSIKSAAVEQDEVRMVNPNLMVNDYIGLYARHSGRFSIGIPGNNLENGQSILYGYPDNSTSYTTFCIDGVPYIFNGENAMFSTDLASENCEWTFNGVHMYQELSFIRNSATGCDDVVEIKYIVTNISDTEKSIGCRIMMDTKLGENDHAPFRVPGYGAITTETEFEGEAIPQIWQAFDNLSNPSVVAQGRFYKNEDERPDKIQFANFQRLSHVSWNLQLSKSASNGDSAVAITWNEEKMAPGESKEYKTYYGLSELTQDLTGPLLLSVYSESELEVIENTYAPNPFPVNAYIENTGSDTMKDVRVKLELPEGLTLTEDSVKTIEIGDIEKGALVQETWNVKAIETDKEQYYKIKIVLEYGNGESKSVTRTVHVPALKKKTLPKALSYTLFSEDSKKPLSMYGWQSYITGNVYSGNDYTYQGSIINVTGKVDTVGKIRTDGWQLHIDESNEAQETISMPDLEADIVEKANIHETSRESMIFSEDVMTMDGTICSEKDISFAGTNFSGTGYIIAKNNINCNLNQGSTYNDGKIIMYAKEGDITLNGSEIALDGILYAPNGTVYVNANIFRLYGRIIAKNIVMNTSQNFIEQDESDISYIYNGDYEVVEPERRGFYENTFLEDEMYQSWSESGMFTAICDAGVEETAWNHITWNGIRMDDSDIAVSIATSEDGEHYSDEVPVINGKEFEEVYGRYAKVTVQWIPSSSDVMPRITDMTVSTENADMLTNAAPILNLEKTIYETEVGVPFMLTLSSQDDAIGNVSSYAVRLNEDVPNDIVLIEDISTLEKQITIEESGIYDFNVVVSDGELFTEQTISVDVRGFDQEIPGEENPEEELPEEENPEEEIPEEEHPDPEEPEYTLTGQIERITFSEDFSKLQIIGTASAQGHLKNYKLSYRLEDGEWEMLCVGEEEIENDVLGEIPTEDLRGGNYVISLEIEDESGNTSEVSAEFEINVEEPTPGEDDEETEEDQITQEQRERISTAKQSAIEWLKGQADENGNWSKNGLMNLTCDALAVLHKTDNVMESSAYDRWASSLAQANVDEQCHAIWGNPSEEAMRSLWSKQNADGGFGLTKTYTSDLYDTFLVLKTELYMQELGYAPVEEEKLLNALFYIASRRNADGGFGYHEKDGSRIALTAEYAVILHKLGLYLYDESLEDFCAELYSGNYEEESYYHQAMLARVQHQIDADAFLAENIDAILSVQKEDGSIYGNVDDTIVFITLLDEMY